MDEATCLQRLTTYAAWTIQNCPSRDPYEGFFGKSVTNEVSQDTLVSEDEIIAQIKKLNDEGLSLAEAKNALSPYQLDQLKILLDNVASKDPERAFTWSLAHLEVEIVQRARRCRPKAAKRKGSRRSGDSNYSSAKSATPEESNAATMTVYLKRAPYKKLDLVQLYAEIQKIELENLKTPPTPPAPDPQQQTDQDRAFDIAEGGWEFPPVITSSSTTSKHRGHREHGSRSKGRSKTRLPDSSFTPYSILNAPSSLAGFDPVAEAYRSGKEDGRKESSNTTVQVQPVERIVQHAIIEPSPSPYSRLEPDARYIDDGFVDELRSDAGYRAERLQRHIEGRLRRSESEYIDRRRSDAFYKRRPNDPIIWSHRHPFFPSQLPRQYPLSRSGY